MKAPKIWNIKKKVMHKPEEIASIHFNQGKIYAITLCYVGILLIKDMKVLRPTERKDKHGKELFEGDLVQLQNCPETLGEIRWATITSKFWIDWSIGKNIWSSKELWPGIYLSEMLKKVGNSYENPELLQEKNK